MQTPTRFYKHIIAITESQCIEIQESEKQNSAAKIEERIILLEDTNISTRRAYAIALHEIGHIVSSSQQDLTKDEECSLATSRMVQQRELIPDTYLQNEVDAWKWARANAVQWSEVMEERAQACLHSYATVTRWETIPNVAVMLLAPGVYRVGV